ncbi:hypothetical protein J7F02_10145 [Streptomyces sp. ISL-112]|uniref:hypothetical protein n=1 Tax=unclassified Streptomyces TaxID=2593676 RepID=UPI001BECBB7D|nr:MULTISPECIES: hypothetical protein [unclassified Streptomyces]MBT2426028.1 hypothetical protein [Streptomyces sp. ISL-112]MBT2461433.1 hypothetical protein [Streptomyces sp. ISL-63]
MTKKHGTGDGGERGAGDDAELAALVAEFSFRKTYRPTDEMAEPDDVPHGPSGTAMGDVAPTAQVAPEPDAP